MPIERLSASVAGRHLACHASANLEAAIHGWTPPEVDPEKGAKGVGHELHRIFQEVNELQSPANLRKFSQALDYIADLRSQRRWKMKLEESVEIDWLSTLPKTTADMVLYTQDELHIVDLKTGKIKVDVVDNEQLLYYACAYADLAPKAKGATLHIVQPWADNMESWYVSAEALTQFASKLQQADKAIQAGDTSFGPSDHCLFCPAYPHSRGDKGKPLCPATMKILYPDHLNEDEILNS